MRHKPLKTSHLVKSLYMLHNVVLFINETLKKYSLKVHALVDQVYRKNQYKVNLLFAFNILFFILKNIRKATHKSMHTQKQIE